jgi:4-hydroxy-tetrahydrodipicolinate reductase
MKRIGVVGATGRTGSKVVEALESSKTATLAAAIASPTSRQQGREIGERRVQVSSDLAKLSGSDAVIEFSTPEVSMAVVESCVSLKLPLLIATTGHTPEQAKRIETAAHQIPILVAPNTSLGAALLAIAVEQVKELAGGVFDIEVMEIHHRMKRDAPSGTARALAAAAISEGQSPVFGREGLRQQEEIGVVSLRGGDVPGDHTVYFLGEGERLELSHKVHDRRVFGAGAVALVERLIGCSPGLYSVRRLLLGS